MKSRQVKGKEKLRMLMTHATRVQEKVNMHCRNKPAEKTVYVTVPQSSSARRLVEHHAGYQISCAALPAKRDKEALFLACGCYSVHG
jgi:hypothetical protein